ncbi:MAG: hypothetical protein HYZ50_06125 [Deltaproteobacteria bacterium]|nr:hypothetical protein [Deltaproteobacteria bacterium]
MDTWNRHMLDHVARAVVSGQRGHGDRIDRLADLVAELIRNRLEAVGAPVAKHARCCPRDS